MKPVRSFNIKFNGFLHYFHCYINCICTVFGAVRVIYLSTRGMKKVNFLGFSLFNTFLQNPGFLQNIFGVSCDSRYGKSKVELPITLVTPWPKI